MDVSVQFLSTVAGSFKQVDGRPKKSPGVTDVHSYTLHTTIRDCADAGAYN